MRLFGFEEKTKEMVRSYFLDAEWKDAVLFDHDIAFGLASAEECTVEVVVDYDYYQAFFSRTGELAKEAVIADMSALRFFKAPQIIFWRGADYTEEKSFKGEDPICSAFARFAMGYTK